MKTKQQWIEDVAKAMCKESFLREYPDGYDPNGERTTEQHVMMTFRYWIDDAKAAIETLPVIFLPKDESIMEGDYVEHSNKQGDKSLHIAKLNCDAQLMNSVDGCKIITRNNKSAIMVGKEDES